MSAFWNRKAPPTPAPDELGAVFARLEKLERTVRALSVDWEEFSDQVLKRMKRTETAARKLERAPTSGSHPDVSSGTGPALPPIVAKGTRPVDLRRAFNRWRQQQVELSGTDFLDGVLPPGATHGDAANGGGEGE